MHRCLTDRADLNYMPPTPAVMKNSNPPKTLPTFALRVAAFVVLAVQSPMGQALGSIGEDPGSLQFARKAFATADADMDGALSAEEARVAGIPKGEFAVRDGDKSGSWSGDEFLVYYSELLRNSERVPDEEFQAEMARIEAARKAQAAREAAEVRRAQEARRKQQGRVKQEQEQEPADGHEVESISDKLRRAREALKDRSKRAGAGREAFERTAGGLAGRARGSVLEEGADTAGASSDPSEEEWAAKLRRARAALERRAKSGSWSREQLQAAERRLIERARAAQLGVDLTELPAPVRSKYERSLVALTERAKAGGWTREKYEAELNLILGRAREELGDRSGGGVGGEPEPEAPGAGTGAETSQSRRDYARALAALDERAKAGGWTRERYEAERAELAMRLQIRDAGDGAGAESSDGGSADEGAAGQADVSDARSKVERAQDVLDARAQRAEMDRVQHSRITKELHERARQALQQITQGADPDLRRKHERALSALIERAGEAGMTRAAFEHKRDQILERARQEANTGMATQEDFDQARRTFTAELVGVPVETRTKYGRALLALISRAQRAEMSRAAFGHERDQLIARAREEAASSGAAQVDFDAAQKALASAMIGTKPELRTKYERALSALIVRAQRAGMSRAAFLSERDQLLQRARAEAAAGTGVEEAGIGEGGGVERRRVETKEPAVREQKPATKKADSKD